MAGCPRQAAPKRVTPLNSVISIYQHRRLTTFEIMKTNNLFDRLSHFSARRTNIDLECFDNFKSDFSYLCYLQQVLLFDQLLLVYVNVFFLNKVIIFQAWTIPYHHLYRILRSDQEELNTVLLLLSSSLASTEPHLALSSLLAH